MATEPFTGEEREIDAGLEQDLETGSSAGEESVAEPKLSKSKAAEPAGAEAEKKKKGKDDKAKKGKGGQTPEPSDDGRPTLAAHPRAARAVARAKSWGGLAGFLIAGYLSLSTNTLAGALARALVAGICCYVVVWAGAVFLWRRLIALEIKGREQELIAAANGDPRARARGGSA